MPRLLIAGGSGYIGQILSRHFAKDYEVVVLSRSPGPAASASRTELWNGKDQGAWSQLVDGAAVVINLTGKSVDCRYNAANRQEIRASRVDATQAIATAIAAASAPPPLWLNAASATTYPASLDCDRDEDSALDPTGFSEEVCRAWEEAFFQPTLPATRRLALRISIAFGPETGGATDILHRLVRYGFGGTAGPGDQMVSWIHTADLARAVAFLIQTPELSGPINLAAPNPLCNQAFMRLFRRAAGRRLGLPAPTPLLHLGAVLLRTEPELILKSRRVVPKRLLQAGFRFEFPCWSQAIGQILASRRSTSRCVKR